MRQKLIQTVVTDMLSYLNNAQVEKLQEVLLHALWDYDISFYENDELIAITKELAETLRKNRTIDWNRREQARARMRMLIKRLLKKHKYPPEGMDDAVQTVMTQCELWTDNMEE